MTEPQPHCDTGPMYSQGGRCAPISPMIAFLDTRTWCGDSTPPQLQSHLSSERLDFTTIPARQQRTAKELFAALLSGPLPLGEYRLAMGTGHALFHRFKRFLIWADGTCPRISLAACLPRCSETTPSSYSPMSPTPATARTPDAQCACCGGIEAP